MNAPHDFERRITDYLHDGPSRAPERAIAGALDHARTHARRRDPLAALRRDTMGSTGFGFGSGMRALPLVAALGLLLVAALAVATVGGFFDRQSVIVPPAVPSPSTPAESAAPPSATPSPVPTPIPSPVVMSVDLVAFDGRVLSTLEVVDESGTLVSASSGRPSDGGSQSEQGKADIANDPADPATVILTWTGLFGTDDRRLTIAPDGRTMTLEVTRGEGDLIPVDRKLILTFSAPVPAGEVTAQIVEVAP